MDGILDKVHEAGLTLKAGCGIGYEFSHPAPARRVSSPAPAPTPPARCRSWISTTRCASPCPRPAAAAARRWAPSTSSHPDVKEFIRAKREDGRLRQFNLSLLITDELHGRGRDRRRLAAGVPGQRQGTGRGRPRRPEPGGLARMADPARTTSRRDDGLVACKIYGHIRARHLWDMIMVVDLRLRRAGFHPDRPRQRDEQQLVVREHPRHQSLRRAAAAAVRRLPAGLGQPDHVRARPLHRPGRASTGRNTRKSCACSPACSTTWSRSTACRCEQQRDEIMRKRRHGMGFLGLGCTLTMLKMKYGSAGILRVHRGGVAARWPWPAGKWRCRWPKEKGPAPIMDEDFDVTAEMLRKRPEMATRRLEARPEDQGPRAARQVQPLHAARGQVAPELVDELAEVGARFTHHSSIAPTGTISLSPGQQRLATASSPASRTTTAAT